MVKNPAFIKHLAQGLALLEEGKLGEAREEFATLSTTCEKMARVSSNEDYWLNMAEGMQQFVDWIDRYEPGDHSGLSDDKRKLIESRIKDIMQGKSITGSSSPGIEYKDGVGQEEKTVDESSTEEVVQDRIEFLEDEVKKSEETLMELKQELDELKDDEG